MQQALKPKLNNSTSSLLSEGLSLESPSVCCPTPDPCADPYLMDFACQRVFASALHAAVAASEPYIDSAPLDLTGFPHWDALVGRGGIPKALVGMPWRVEGGCFYGMSGYPDFAALPSVPTLWTNCRLSWVRAAYPTLPGGVIPLPGPVEGILVVHEDAAKEEDPLTTTLRASMGGHALRELRRFNRWASETYRTEFYCAHEVYPYLDAVATLHEDHARRHGNALNIFARPVLDAFYHSTLQSDLILFLRRDKQTKEILQAVWGYQDTQRKVLYILTQAKRASLGKSPGNLLLEALYQIYRYWWQQGFTQFNIGRGTMADRQRLGANQIFCQGHYIFAPNLGRETHGKIFA